MLLRKFVGQRGKKAFGQSDINLANTNDSLIKATQTKLIIML